MKYRSKTRQWTIGSTRRSQRYLDTKAVDDVTVDTNAKHDDYDLNSRKLRRYIIKNAMHINPVESVLLLLCEDSQDVKYWKKIIQEQNSGLSDISFGSKVFHQINATVIKYISREAFINGSYDNDMMDYHVLGIGGAAISISFSKCMRSTGIELKSSPFLTDVNI